MSRSVLLSVSILVISLFVVGAIVYSKGNSTGGIGTGTGAGSGNNVSMADGKQVIKIDARGGYLPRVTFAKADVPTVLKLNTRGTFDCSSAVVIPSLNYRANLPPSGETLLDIPPQKAGTKMQGLCAMGMYNFTLNFD